MDEVNVALRIEAHIGALVAEAGHRPPGSPANRRATDLVASALAAAGLPAEAIDIQARWWEPGIARLTVDGVPVAIDPSPFCGPAHARGRVRVLHDDEALGRLATAAGVILVLRDELAVPCFPKSFPFVADPDQQRRIARLEALGPEAVLAVVPDADAHEPVFEDPALSFPYATVPASKATLLLDGADVDFVVESSLHDGPAVNLSAGTLTGPRTVLCAHVDSKVTTPGALDNGGGVATLLAFAEEGLDGLGPVELVFFNGEDHYDAPGEQAWLAGAGLRDVELVINIDGAGLRGYPTAVSILGDDPTLEALVARCLADAPDAVAGPPWFESDHAIFAMQGIPAIAITSGAPFDVLKRASHAADDAPGLVDPRRLAGIAGLVRSLLAARAADAVAAR